MFFYGTLKRGGYNHPYCRGGRMTAGASIEGLLYDLPEGYPAIVVPEGTVRAVGTDDPLADAILAACRRTGERAWRMPLDDDFQDALKSDVADLKNIGGKWGGSITAAKFLQQFVGDVPWAHLDIAGPSWADSDSSTRDAGGTGCFVRTLVDLVEAGAGD